MEEKIYTVDQVAKLLDMHPKTIRNYIRSGKLRARKVGKEWRISGHDLSVFVEDGDQPAAPVVESEAIAPPGAGESGSETAGHKVMVSAVVDIAIADKNEYMRLSNTLIAILSSGNQERGLSTINMRYFERERRLKVMIWGIPSFVEGIIGAVAALTEE